MASILSTFSKCCQKCCAELNWQCQKSLLVLEFFFYVLWLLSNYTMQCNISKITPRIFVNDNREQILNCALRKFSLSRSPTQMKIEFWKVARESERSHCIYLSSFFCFPSLGLGNTARARFYFIWAASSRSFQTSETQVSPLLARKNDSTSTTQKTARFKHFQASDWLQHCNLITKEQLLVIVFVH